MDSESGVKVLLPRIGFGFDAHRFGGPPPLRLAGVAVDEERGLAAWSDGDAAAHAAADALLGAASLGDLGVWFPSGSGRWEGADSMEILARVVEMVESAGMSVGNLDLTVIAQNIRIAPHREAMQARLSSVLGVGADRVSVKATTADGMGFTGRGEGVAVWATVLLMEAPPAAEAPGGALGA